MNKFWLILAIVFALHNSSTQGTVSAQDHHQDLQSLLAGEVVNLDWGYGVAWRDEDMPSAATLISSFLASQIQEDKLSEQLLYAVLQYASPEMRTYRGVVYLGLNATTATWNSETATLTIQAGRYIPALLPNGEINGRGCGGEWGSPAEVVIVFDNCQSEQGRLDGAPHMPNKILYKNGELTIEFLPPG